VTIRFLVYGVGFGFLLSRIGASDPAAIRGMFDLGDLHLFGVIGTAVALNAVAFWLLRRAGVRARGGAPLALEPKPMRGGLVAGALVFGAGWAISGACPGTALAQIGEGRLGGAVVAAGILLGAWLQARAPWPARRVA
jgi:uncharacterized membrane protein YedE/YeeE